MWQIELFKEIRDTRPHICEVCKKKIGKPEPQCFSHCLAKWSYPQRKLDKNNIGLVCWSFTDCHEIHDRSFEWIQWVIKRRLNKWLYTSYDLALEIHKDDREEIN